MVVSRTRSAHVVVDNRLWDWHRARTIGNCQKTPDRHATLVAHYRDVSRARTMPSALEMPAASKPRHWYQVVAMRRRLFELRRKPHGSLPRPPLGGVRGERRARRCARMPRRCSFWEGLCGRAGAPTRIALSRDGEDVYDCVLLDHIPANPASRPTYMQDSTYTPYRITVMIPDVQCERCSLQLVNPMTDKVNDKCQYREGSPQDAADFCQSVYHSCTLPLRIKGQVPRRQLTCRQPDAWPYNGLPYGVYSREQASWTSDGWLASVPAAFTQSVGACAGQPYTNSLATSGPAYLCAGKTQFVPQCGNCVQTDQCIGAGVGATCCPYAAIV